MVVQTDEMGVQHRHQNASENPYMFIGNVQSLSNRALCITRHVIHGIILYHFTDIHECSEGISGCNQVCSNTIGSYYCTCFEGYYLGGDNHTCLGL